MTSSENRSVTKNSNHFVQKFLTKDGIGNNPYNAKSPIIYNPSPMLNPQCYEMQKVQTPFQVNSSDFSNICDSPDFMDTLAKKILQHMRNK